MKKCYECGGKTVHREMSWKDAFEWGLFDGPGRSGLKSLAMLAMTPVQKSFGHIWECRSCGHTRYNYIKPD